MSAPAAPATGYVAFPSPAFLAAVGEAALRALAESALSGEQRETWWRWLEPFSVRMINRRTMGAQPPRYVQWTALLPEDGATAGAGVA